MHKLLLDNAIVAFNDINQENIRTAAVCVILTKKTIK